MPPSKTLGNGSKLLITTSRHLRRVRNNTIIKDQFRDFITASLLCPRGERSYIFSTLNPLITDTFYGPLRGCLHDTGATFAPELVLSGSLSWLYICLHDTTTKCHAGASHPGVSSPRFLYRGENWISLRYEISQRYHVNAKRPPDWNG